MHEKCGRRMEAPRALLERTKSIYHADVRVAYKLFSPFRQSRVCGKVNSIYHADVQIVCQIFVPQAGPIKCVNLTP